MKYRPHIDGLRTLAVVPVVLYHIQNNLIPGGFVGVDVFFVISGYLITSLLFEDMRDGSYSLLEFYKRRALRIFPALLFMLLGVALASSLLLLPHERESTGYSIVAASTFLSNIWFWKEAGYFSAPAETQVLLHTWSLAVEEQFYLFFPPILYLFVRFASRHVLGVIIGISALSLAVSVVVTGIHQPSAFYLIPFRAWELGIGAILAVSTIERRLPMRGRVWPALVGLALVVMPMAVLNNQSVFPGWNALAPALGTALIIGWGEKGIVGRVLSLGPTVLVGRISYSLYLWHWPIIVFWKLSNGNHLGSVDSVSIFALSFLLAWFSTSYVERPFRSARARNARAGPVVANGTLALMATAFLGFLSANGVPQIRSFSQRVVEIADVANYARTPDHSAQFRNGAGRCLISQDRDIFDDYNQILCASPNDTKPNVLLIGDSHAAQYWRSLQDAFSDVNVMQANVTGCRALVSAKGKDTCIAMREWVFDQFLPQQQLDAIVLGGRWKDEDIQLVGPTLGRLLDHADKVIVIGPLPEYDGVLPLLLSQSVLRKTAFDTEMYLQSGRFEINRRMSNEVAGTGALYIDVISQLCDSDSACAVWASDDTPLQYDYGHLTLHGASDLVTAVAPDMLRYLAFEQE